MIPLYSNGEQFALISIGEFPVGVIAIGGNPLGIIAVGGFARGVVAIGMISFGVFTASCCLSIGVLNAFCGVGAGLLTKGLGLSVSLRGDIAGLNLEFVPAEGVTSRAAFVIRALLGCAAVLGLLALAWTGFPLPTPDR